MNAVRILCLETALSGCSVCLSENEIILAQAVSKIPNSASDQLHTLVADVLQSSGIQLSDLHAIAVSIGPGSYTGLRIGVAAAKGYAYALRLPVIAVSTLQMMSAAMIYRHNISADLYIPAIDARRNEIFWAMYDKNLKAKMGASPLIVDDTTKNLFDKDQKIIVFGSGAQKLFDAVQLPNLSIYTELDPEAKDMAALANAAFLNNQFADLAYLEPDYTKAFYHPSIHINNI